MKTTDKKRGRVTAAPLANHQSKHIHINHMKRIPPIDIPGGGIVNLPPAEVERAEALALDDKTIWALTDLIFSQKDPEGPVSLAGRLPPVCPYHFRDLTKMWLAALSAGIGGVISVINYVVSMSVPAVRLAHFLFQ